MTKSKIYMQGALNVRSFRQRIRKSKSYNYIYINNPKAACSTIKKSLWSAEANCDSKFGEPVEKLIHKARHEKAPLTNRPVDYIDIEDVYIFSFVRNPYARALSCYIDKILLKCPDSPKRFAYSDFLNRFELTENHDISFGDFLEFIKTEPPQEMNPHWRPQVYNLFYGFIPFSFIGHLERINIELPLVLKTIFSTPINFVSYELNVTNALKKFNRYYSSHTRQLVEEIYRDDFEVFRYPKDLNFLSPEAEIDCGKGQKQNFLNYYNRFIPHRIQKQK